jgi:hypothetical protein
VVRIAAIVGVGVRRCIVTSFVVSEHLRLSRAAVLCSLDLHRSGVIPMQVATSGAAAGPRLVSIARAQMRSAEPAAAQAFGIGSKDINFASITPKALHAYIDEKVMSGDIGETEMLQCSSLFCSIPDEWYSDSPDVAVDVASRVESMADFARAHESISQTKFYEEMLDWMRMSEAKSVHISAVA